ncbi:serine O-acetyltransferase [Pontibacillus litoralis]|uniref:serine O-acetyltransferase n=1 Tax=Pontibacillus litoralis JSM 072002 TaxID=1385512 RepID=A0A0A5FTY5_9BACI|nr:serine O-acetyltransferase [Pontibacillus litoralis]KGX84246.1 hypothetical protein N784_14475 [Pontibacillus litoralis JSM 072002]
MNKTSIKQINLDIIINDIKSILNQHLDDEMQKYVHVNNIIKIARHIMSDLKFFAIKDPASNKELDYIYNTYYSFKTVMYYRIANELVNISRNNIAYQLKHNANKLSQYIKVQTAIEIHPAAEIGVPFVIDHGTGTVIGETAKIGRNCYMLQGVVLGSEGIANNSSGKRHPTIGNNVEIGAHVRIFGPITIGDHVKISPYSIILNDIPSSSNVIVQSEYQVNKSKAYPIKVFGVIPREASVLEINGEYLSSFHLFIKDTNHLLDKNIVYQIIDKSDNKILVQITPLTIQIDKNTIRNLSLVFEYDGKEVLIINRCMALEKILLQQIEC